MPTTELPRGRKTKLRLAWESTFGTNPASGFQELNTYSNDLTRTRALQADDVLGAGFNDTIGARPAAPDVEDGTAKLTVPFDLLQCGFWLAAAMGRVNPTGSGPYVHTFAVGSTPIPSATLEREFAAAAQYDGGLGMVVKSLKLPFKPGKGYAMVDLDLVGKQVLEPYASTAAGTPTVAALGNQVPSATGVLKVGGTQIGSILSADLTLSNDLDLDRYVGSANFISAAILTGADASLDISARYNTDALRAYGALGGSSLPPIQSVEMDWVLGAMSLVVTMPNVRFEPVNAPVTNGKTITQALKGRAEVGSNTAMLTAVLTNTRATQY